MRITNLKYVILLGVLCSVIHLQAARSYSCDFEDEASRNRWVLKTFASTAIESQIVNKWYMGALGNNTPQGEYGIYISNDNGVGNDYTNQGCFVFAYDTLTLDHLASGDYQFSFDYRGMGNVTSNFDGIYAFWIPLVDPDTGDTIKIFSSPNGGQIPSLYQDYVIQLQPTAQIDYLNAASTWEQCKIKLSNKLCDGKPHYLVFAWGNTSATAQQPAASIDNIVITDDRTCVYPTKLKVDIKGTVSTFTWNNTGAMAYEVCAYDYTNGKWYGPVLTTDTAMKFTYLPAGQVDFYVRSWCDVDLASLRVGLRQLVYYPDEMCVDYLNLSKAKCYINATKPEDTRTFNNFIRTSAVDYGPYSIDSRHTIHFDHREREPRSGGLLKTIPDDELASIRLGNWKNGSEAERIEFNFVVDTIKYPVLLLKYATLLEAPGHSDAENPRFKMELLVGGKSIGACGTADFNCNDVYKSGQLLPGAAEQGWHVTPSSVAGTSADVVWKDWTTVGVNLRKKEYAGKTLTARLTTFDCPLGAHSGYAYFTLGCSDGNLKDMKCGVMNPVFKAPDGFVYRWLKAENAEKYHTTFDESLVKWRTQEVNAGYHDDTLYIVDCMFVGDTSCFFSLYATTLATNPVPVISQPKIKEECLVGYHVTFDGSQSYIRERYIDGEYPERSYDRKSQVYHTESYEWTCNGQVSYDEKPTFHLPTSKGTYDVTLRTTYGTCDSTVHYILQLDTLTAVRDTMYVQMCDNQLRKGGYKWAETGKTYHTFGLDSVTYPTSTCDSIIYLLLAPPTRVRQDTLLFDNELPLRYRGREYYTSVIDTFYTEACDTSWILDFTAYTSLSASLRNMPYQVCPENNGKRTIHVDYTIQKGSSRAFSIEFSDPLMPSVKRTDLHQGAGVAGEDYTLDLPLDSTVAPNRYSGLFTLYDTLPAYNMQFPIEVYVNYPNTILTQRWNDVLSIKNAAYNGGYTFDSYQWYKNDDPIQGATLSYLYASGNLDMNAKYKVYVTRAADQVGLWICPCQPKQVSESEYPNLPTLVPASSQIMMRGQGKACWYGVTGNMIISESYDDSSISTPASSGVYFMQLVPENAAGTTYRMVVR